MGQLSSTWLTKDGFSYIEVAESCSCSIGETATGKREFIVPWEDRFDFANAALPSVSIVNNVVTWKEPWQFPGLPQMLAKTAEIAGFGKFRVGQPDDSAVFDYARVTLNYELQGGSINGQVATGPGGTAMVRTSSLSVGGEVLETPKNHFKWFNDGEVVEQPIGILFPHLEVTVVEEHVPVLDITRYTNAFGKMNNEVFFGVGKWKALYLGVETRETVVAKGLRTWELTHRLKVRPQRWDYALRPGLGWQQLNPSPYDVWDFNAILQSLGP